jgi:Cytidylate kinase
MDRDRPYLDSQDPSTIELLAARLRSAPARAGATRVLAIDGRSGSGKSSLARALAERLEAAPVVSLEDLYGGWDGLERGVALLRESVFEPLAQGLAASVPRYDWLAESWSEPWTLAPPPVLIVEGAGAGAGALARFTSLLVWLELGASRRRERALAREYGELYAPQWERWARQEDAYLERERPRERADFTLADAAG